MNYADDATRLQVADALRMALTDAIRNTPTANVPKSDVTACLSHAELHGRVSPAMSGNAFLNRQIPPTFDGRPTKTIAFAAELVRAILAGRKTQTRRLVRPLSSTKPAVDRCPIAAVGDYLAVREAWAKTGDRYVYAADAQVGVTKFRPAMYMPRDASRIKLAVLAANAERLTAITRDAALAEGCPIDQVDPVQWFTGLWDGIFKAAGERFADDPWVWVITFTVAEIKA